MKLFLRHLAGVPVLMFHGLCEQVPAYAQFPGGRTCLLQVEAFANLIAWCSQNFDILTLAELESYLAGKCRRLRPLLLTFDDGLASVLDLALPILRSHRAPAVVFVTTAWTEAGITPPIFALERFVWENLPLQLSLQVGAQTLNLSLSNQRAIAPGFEAIWAFLFAERFPPLQLQPAQILVQGEPWNPNSVTPDRHFWFPASWAELRSLVASGLIEIGSHMVNHVPLPWLSGAEQAQQLSQSRQILASQLNQPIAACAYPHGVYDASVSALAAQSYRWSFTVQPGRFRPGMFAAEVPRYHVAGEAPAQTAALIQQTRLRQWLGRVLNHLHLV